MAGTKKPSSQTEGSSSSLAELQGMLGGNSSLDLGGLSAPLLWMSVVATLNSGVSLQVSLNKARTSVIITLYDGQFPHKEYCEGLVRTHFVLASIVRAYLKKGVPVEWEDELRAAYEANRM